MAGIWIVVSAAAGFLLGIRCRAAAAMAASLIAASVGAVLGMGQGWGTAAWSACAAWVALQASYLLGASLRTVIARRRAGQK